MVNVLITAAEWRTLNYKPLYLLLADQFIDRIEAGMFPQGSYLPGVREIMKSYGVSMATVRSALEILKDKGYVEAVAGSGVVVIYERREEDEVPPEEVFDVKKDINHLFDFRIIIETEALRDSFERIDAKSLVKSYDAVKPGSADEINEVDAQMHDEIHSKCQNPYTLRTLSEIMKRIELYRQLNFRAISPDVRCVYKTIGQIVESIADGDVDAAVDFLKLHIDETRRSLIDFLDKSGGSLKE